MEPEEPVTIAIYDDRIPLLYKLSQDGAVKILSREDGWVSHPDYLGCGTHVTDVTLKIEKESEATAELLAPVDNVPSASLGIEPLALTATALACTKSGKAYVDTVVGVLVGSLPKEFVRKHIPTPEHVTAAEKMLDEWRLTNAKPASFKDAVRAAVSHPFVAWSDIGLVVTAVNRATAAKAAKNPKAASDFFGSPGKPIDLELRVHNCVIKPSEWNSVKIITGTVAGTRNRWVWFCTSYDTQGLLDESWNPVKGVVQVTAMVKRHIESERFGKQTVLARVAAK